MATCLDHLFRIAIIDVGKSEYAIESILCDDFRIRNNKSMGFKRIFHESSGSVDIHGEFVFPLDINIAISDFAKSVRTMVYKAAGRFVEVRIVGYRVEGGKVHTGWAGEFLEMREGGELRLDIDCIEEDMYEDSQGY